MDPCIKALEKLSRMTEKGPFDEILHPIWGFLSLPLLVLEIDIQYSPLRMVSILSAYLQLLEEVGCVAR